MSYGGVMVDNSSVNFYYMLRPKRKQIKQIATETIYHYKPKGRFFWFVVYTNQRDGSFGLWFMWYA